jgi:hypothetical protein
MSILKNGKIKDRPRRVADISRKEKCAWWGWRGWQWS